MAIIEFDTEEEMDEHFEMIEELNYEYLNLKEAVHDARRELEQAEKELADFKEDNREYLV